MLSLNHHLFLLLWSDHFHDIKLVQLYMASCNSSVQIIVCFWQLFSISSIHYKLYSWISFEEFYKIWCFSDEILWNGIVAGNFDMDFTGWYVFLKLVDCCSSSFCCCCCCCWRTLDSGIGLLGIFPTSEWCRDMIVTAAAVAGEFGRSASGNDDDISDE